MATPVSPGVVSTVPLTGQNHIDSLLDDYKWGGSTGTGTSLTYSFRTNSSSYSTDSVTGYGPSSGSGEPWKSGWYFLTDTQKIGIKAALNAWADVANVRFTEIIDSSTVAGDIRFSTEPGITVSHAWFPWPSAKAGDVWFATSSNLNTSTKGTYGYLTFLHEIGHALGLDHPHEGRVEANPSIDALPFTVMSYRDFVGDTLTGYASDFFPTTPMLDDIAAIQYLYGANMTTRSGDTTYSWTLGQAIYETIWDGGGNDTIDWSNQSSAATINLNAGQWNYLGPVRWDGHASTQQNLTIAYNVVIENATGGSGNDTLIGNSVGNTLNGGAGNDQLYGGAGDDVFDWDASSRGGADTMYGGLGDDQYVIDSLSDVVVELSGEGNDVIWAALTYSIANVGNVENLFLFGTQSVNATGNALANELRGNDANNLLYGGAGNDLINGGAGADTMVGGIGNDSFVVDDIGDTITEALNEGTDIIFSSITYTLGANLENLTLTGTANINATGNTLNNVLVGNSGANILNGGLDADTMMGGAGNDTYVVDNVGDIITENLNQGTDTVQSSITYTVGSNLENLTLTGTSAINGTGNELINVLTGNSAANVLNGYAGNDTLIGGDGTDKVVMGGIVSQYQFSQSSGNNVVTSWEGTDTLNSVEYIRFGSSSYTTDVPSSDATTSNPVHLAEQITDLYVAYFNRGPDAEGFDYWFHEIYTAAKSLRGIAEDFAWSNEYQSMYPSTLTNRQFVEQIYQNLFDRGPDQGGWDYWSGRLDTGSAHRSGFILDVIEGAYASTSGPEDRTLIDNKHDASLYYTGQLAIHPQEGYDFAIVDLLNRVTGNVNTVAAAEGVIDYAFNDPITLTGVMTNHVLLDSLWANV